MTVIANVFPKFLTDKDLVKKLSQNCRFRKSFDSQHVEVSQTLVKAAWEIFYHILWLLWEETNWKISPLLNFETLLVLVNTLTADKDYPLGHSGDFQFRNQMQLS